MVNDCGGRGRRLYWCLMVGWCDELDVRLVGFEILGGILVGD